MDDNDDEQNDDSGLTNAYHDEVARESDFSVDESAGETTRTEQFGKESSTPTPSIQIPGHQIVRLLGRGGMGSVFEAIELSLSRRVAVKTLFADPTHDKQLIRRFEIETRAVAQLDHDNIVRIYQVGSNHDVYYYTMQLIEGPNLALVISDIKDRNKGLPKSTGQDTPRRGFSKTKPEKNDERPSHPTLKGGGSSESKRLRVSELVQAFSSRRANNSSPSFYKTVAMLGSEIATALAHAHEQGVIHRDIKPSNILIDETGKPWVTDFGLAIMLDNPVATRPGDVVGTYRYMSPEQASGRRFLIDHRTDIYSLGVTLYELVTLNAPFTASNPRDLLRQVSFEEPKSARSSNPGVPEELEIIIAKSMAKNPQDRFATAREFADDLRRFATDQPILAKRASMAKRARRWIGMHQTLVAAAVCVILFFAISSMTALGFVWSSLVREHGMLLQVERERDSAEGRRLLALAGQNLNTNPGLSLLLASEGAALAPGDEAHKALFDSLAATHERKTRFLNGAVVGSLDVSRDGRFVVATMLPDSKQTALPALIFDVASADLKRTLSDRVSISHAVFSPSGNVVITAGGQSSNKEEAKNPIEATDKQDRNTSVMLWSMVNEQSAIALKDAVPRELSRGVFSADGRWVVLPSTENSVSIFDCVTGEIRMRVHHHQNPVRSALLFQDGTKAVSLDTSGLLCLWETKEGKLLAKYQSRYPVTDSSQLYRTHDSSRLILSCDNGTVCVQADEDKLLEIARWREPEFAVNPKLTQVATYWSLNRLIHIRDYLTGENLMELELPGPPSRVQYTPDGRFLVAATDNLLVVVEPNTRREVFRLSGNSDSITAVGFDDSFQNIVTGAYDESLRIWSTKSLLEQNEWDVKCDPTIPTRDQYIATSDRIAVATAAMKETVILMLDAKRTRRLAAGRLDCDFHDSEKSVVIDESMIRVFDVANQKKIAEVAIPYSRILSARTIPGTDDVLVHLQNEQLLRWNVVNQSLLPFRSSLNQVMSWHSSPDGRGIVLLGIDGTCELYNAATGAKLAALSHSDSVISSHWAGENSLFTITQDGALHHWDPQKREEVAYYQRNGFLPNSLMLCDKGKKLLAYHDFLASSIVCWDVETERQLWSVEGVERSVLRLNTDEKLVAVSSATKGTSLLDIETGTMTSISTVGTTDAQFIEETLVLLETGPEKHGLNHPEIFSSDSGEFKVRCVDYKDMSTISRMELKSKPTKLSVDRKSSSVLLTLDSWQVAICDRATRGVNHSVSFPSPIAFIRSVPNSVNWIAASADGTCRLLDDVGGVLKEIGEDLPPVVTGDVSPDGTLVALGHLNGEVRVYSLTNSQDSNIFRVHLGPVKQVEIPDGGKYVFSLSEGILAKSDLRTSETQKYESSLGFQAFIKPKSDEHMFLLIGTDKGELRSLQVSNDYGQLQPNVKIGNAESLDLVSMTSKQISDTPVISLDYSNETDTVAMLCKDERIVILKGKDASVLTQWRELPVDLVALRWGKNGRLAAMTKRGDVLTLNLEGKKIESQIVSRRKSMRHYHAFRNQWNPIDSVQDAYVVFKPKLSLLPVDLPKFAAEHLPRDFSEQEREVLRINLQNELPK